MTLVSLSDMLSLFPWVIWVPVRVEVDNIVYDEKATGAPLERHWQLRAVYSPGS